MSTLTAVFSPRTWGARRQQRRDAEARRAEYWRQRRTEFFERFGFYPENIEERNCHTQTMLYFAKLAQKIREQQGTDVSDDERQFLVACELIRSFHPDLAASVPHWSTMMTPEVALANCRHIHDPQMRALKNMFMRIGD